MAKTLKLLLTENVDSLGIVGDVVNVRTGYARNFLLPRNLATQPSDDLIKQLATKRAEAEKQLALLRKQREELNQKMQGVELELVRPCNDQGILYGAITQQELAKLLGEKGYDVKPREVRISETIKRVGTYEFHVKLDSDLDAPVKLKVQPDRELEAERKDGEPAAGAEAPERESRDDRRERERDERRRQRGIDFDKLMAPDVGSKPGEWAAAKTAAPAEAGAPPAAPAEKKAEGGKKDKPAKAEKADKGEKKSRKKAE